MIFLRIITTYQENALKFYKYILNSDLHFAQMLSLGFSLI